MLTERSSCFGLCRICGAAHACRQGSACRPGGAYRAKRANSQRGLVTLGVALAILVLASVAVLAVARALTVEQMVIGSQWRAAQAFEAAEAGLQQALAYLIREPDRDADGQPDPVFDSDGDGVGDSDLQQFGSSLIRVTVTDLTGDLRHLQVTAQGSADDGSTQRRVTQELVVPNALPDLPGLPLLVTGDITISGSAMVLNPAGGATLRSGGDLAAGEDPATVLGPAPVTQDAELAALVPAALFRKFFGRAPQQYRNALATQLLTAAAAQQQLSAAQSGLLWVEGDLELDSVRFGCAQWLEVDSPCPEAAQQPGIVVVNGSFSSRGSTQLHGLLFVLGSVVVEGELRLHGALVLAGSLQVAGELELHYDSVLLQAAAYAGRRVALPGSWRDF